MLNLLSSSQFQIGENFVFVDGDYSAHTNDIPYLLEACISGNDLVIGARVAGRRQAGALTPHQISGNHFAAWLLRQTWGQPTTDLGPLRAIHFDALQRLDMAEPTFGWTMEMQAKALQLRYRVCEVPVSTRRRIGVSKVSGTWKGSIGATWGILSTYLKIAWREPFIASQALSNAAHTDHGESSVSCPL